MWKKSRKECVINAKRMIFVVLSMDLIDNEEYVDVTICFCDLATENENGTFFCVRPPFHLHPRFRHRCRCPLLFPCLTIRWADRLRLLLLLPRRRRIRGRCDEDGC